MATTITHLLIGERVFAQLPRLNRTPTVYGAFLLGCMLVDAHNFDALARRQTHFAELFKSDDSCANFMRQLDASLLRPWNDLDEAERAFVAGYLCHLAADQVWVNFWRVRGVNSPSDFDLPRDVMLLAFNALSREMFEDFAGVVSALEGVVVPHALAHVPHDDFARMWSVTRSYALAGGTPKAYFKLLEARGQGGAEIQTVRQQHELYKKDAADLIRDAGGIQRPIRAAVKQAIRLAPQLWGQDDGASYEQ
jgi:hypothetical protein